MIKFQGSKNGSNVVCGKGAFLQIHIDLNSISVYYTINQLIHEYTQLQHTDRQEFAIAIRILICMAV